MVIYRIFAANATGPTRFNSGEFNLSSHAETMAETLWFRLIQREHGGGACNCWRIISNDSYLIVGEIDRYKCNKKLSTSTMKELHIHVIASNLIAHLGTPTCMVSAPSLTA